MTMTLDISPKYPSFMDCIEKSCNCILVQNSMSLITQTFMKCFLTRIPGKQQGKGELEPSPFLLK